MIESDPIFSNAGNIFLPREQRYLRSMRKARKFFELKRSLALNTEDTTLLSTAINDTLPTFIHNLMFVPNIETLGTAEQQAEWLPKCHSMEVIGCYAQTELGHGSNIRALETTATYIKDTDEVPNMSVHSRLSDI